MYGERENAFRVFVGKPEERNHLKAPGVDVRIILRWIFRKWVGGMDWICVAQERDRWRTVVNVVKNSRVL
jgi:hypothetical protein